MSYIILAINPGSTSTKIAVYEDTQPVLSLAINHSAAEIAAFATIGDQFEWRKDLVLESLRKRGFDIGTLSAVIGRGTKYDSRSTGELEQSLGLSPVKLNREGNHDIKIGFSEPRSDGGSNAKLANILEYGKHGQPAKPFLKPGKSASKAECIRVMEQTLKEEVEKL